MRLTGSMRLTGWLTVLALATGCATALDRGERRYREGDRRGALEIWREVPADDAEHAAVTARIETVEAELDRLVIGYEEGAHIGEAEGRLAEAILDYRLALELQPDDAASLAHVQRLARELASRKRTQRATYEHDRARGDLEAARQSLARLRKLDPFDPEFETEERQLQAEINAEWERRSAQIRAQLADEVEPLIEAGRDAFRNEQLETALDLWRRALLIDPENERLRAYISRAERQLENLERLRAEPESTARQ